MILRLATVLFAGFALTAQAEVPRELTLQRPGESASTVLPLPAGATTIECDKEAILNFYCLRADASNEPATLATLTAAIEQQGWTLLGADTEKRPYTYIYRRAQAGTRCPQLIMITSTTSTQGSRPPLQAGMIEIQLTQTVDMTCLFD